MSKITKSAVAVLIALALSVIFVFSTAFANGFTFTASAEPVTENVIINTGVTDSVKYGDSFNVDATASVKTPGGLVKTGVTSVTADEVGIYEVTYTSDGSNKGSYTYNVECYMEYEYKLIVDNYGATIPTYWKKDSADITLPGATLYYYDEDVEKWLPAKDSSVVYCRVTVPGKASVEKDVSSWTDSDRTISPDTEGVYFFTYYAKLAGGKNVISQEYTMQVQRTFSDTSAPTLVVSGMPSSASVGTQVSLPKATVTDDYDTRVYTEIRVTHDYGDGKGVVDVKDVVIDEKTGYAAKDPDGNTLYYKADANGGYAYSGSELATTTKPEEAVTVKFDNDSFMSFYPADEGTYTVTYSAKDSTGYYGGENDLSNSTTQRNYQISVSDTSAPVYDELDSSLIPSQWGYYGVYRKYVDGKDASDPDEEPVKIAQTIQFPIPELYDNKDDESALRASFTITDPSNKTVMTFRNILLTEHSGDCSYAPADYDGGNKTYYFFRYWETEGYTVDESTGKITGNGIGDNAYSLVYYDTAAGKVTKGFFDFNKYKPGNSAIGSYTVTYVARDTKGNGSTQSFSIDLQSSFTDEVAPVVDFDAPAYFAFGASEKEDKIEDVDIRDTQDSRLDVKYYIIFNKGTLSVDNDLTLESGLTEGDNYYEMDYTAGTNTFTLVRENGANVLTVTDKDGVEHDVTVTSASVYVAASATDAVGNNTFKCVEISVLDATDDTAKSATTAFGTLNTEDATVGEEYLLGSATVTYATAADRNYTGFELYVQRVKDGDGKEVNEDPLSAVSFETYSDNGNAVSGAQNTLHIDNIRFTPGRSGVYMVVLRGYYISGKSETKMVFVTANGGSGSGSGVASGVGLPTTMEYGQTYEFNDTYTTNLENAGILHSVTGGRIKVMGNEVTAYSIASYTFKDYVFKYETSTDGTNDNKGSVKYDLTGNKYNGISSEYEEKGRQYTQVSDTQTLTINLQGAMPTYSEKFSSDYTGTPNVVVLPNVSASSKNGNAADLKITVTDPDGVDMTGSVYMAGDVDSMFDEYKNAYQDLGITLEGNMAVFFPEKDGTYTVTYSASLNGQTATASYTIKAGDVVAPAFTADIGSIDSVLKTADSYPSTSVGAKFDFARIVVQDPSNTGYTYSKQLISPEGDVVFTVTTADRINNGNSYELTSTGLYQVVYSVTDEVGNTSTLKYSIVVTSTSGNISSDAVTTLAVVLIIVGVILIAGVIIYMIRFRKRKGSKSAK